VIIRELVYFLKDTHAAGIILRNISPENIVFTKKNDLKTLKMFNLDTSKFTSEYNPKKNNL
jgi:serine/threonine protein kinase